MMCDCVCVRAYVCVPGAQSGSPCARLQAPQLEALETANTHMRCAAVSLLLQESRDGQGCSHYSKRRGGTARGLAEAHHALGSGVAMPHKSDGRMVYSLTHAQLTSCATMLEEAGWPAAQAVPDRQTSPPDQPHLRSLPWGCVGLRGLDRLGSSLLVMAAQGSGVHLQTGGTAEGMARAQEG